MYEFNLNWNRSWEPGGVGISRPLQFTSPFAVISYFFWKSCPHTEGCRTTLSCTWLGGRVYFVASARITEAWPNLKPMWNSWNVIKQIEAWRRYEFPLDDGCWTRLPTLRGSKIGIRTEGTKIEDGIKDWNKYIETERKADGTIGKGYEYECQKGNKEKKAKWIERSWCVCFPRVTHPNFWTVVTVRT
jgi:hypothetical protein